MKILMVIDDLRSGGAQRQLVSLAIDFKKNGYEVSFLIYIPHFFYAPILEANKIQIVCIENKYILKRIFDIRKYLRNHKPDVVISFMGIPSLLCEIASLPLRRWILIVGERSADPKILRSGKSIIIRYFHLLADFIVANSFENIKLIQRVNPFLRKDKLFVIYNSIDLNLFYNDESYIFQKGGVLRIIVPASYRLLKNPLGLIEAVNLLSENEKSRLVIDWFGDKTYKSHNDNVLEQCELLIDKYKLGNTIHLNDVNYDIKTIMRDYDMVGLFSFFEGLPNAVCEGMACGKAIISSNVSDISKLILDENNGFLCNPNDILSIKNGIQKAIECGSMRLNTIGNNNRERAEKLFDNKLIINEYIKLINSKS